ncbi:MAG: hypothetical protein KDI13_02525 [Alphaproteobacteria bacterium]|nr:hypothetical protein [Alphaproteobacteria bacterium]
MKSPECTKYLHSPSNLGLNTAHEHKAKQPAATTPSPYAPLSGHEAVFNACATGDLKNSKKFETQGKLR